MFIEAQLMLYRLFEHTGDGILPLGHKLLRGDRFVLSLLPLLDLVLPLLRLPLAFLGRVRGEQEGQVLAPAWWWSAEGISASPAPAPQRRSVPPPPPLLTAPSLALAPSPVATLPLVASSPSLALDPRLDTLGQDEKLALALLQENQSVRLSILAPRLKKAPMRAAGFMRALKQKLFDLGCPCIAVEVLPDNDQLYSYVPVDRDRERGSR